MSQSPQTPDEQQTIVELQEKVNDLEKIVNDQGRFFNIALDLLCTASLTTGHFVLLNPMWEKVTGWTFDELRAQPFLTFVHPDDVQPTIEAASTLGTGKDIISFTNRYRCKDGSYRWIEWLSTTDLEQGLIYAAARDITERKEAEDALRQQNELLMQQTETLRQLATPLIPLAENVIVMPLIGNIDTPRARQIMEVLLEGVAANQAEIVIIDITGVQVVDTAVANALLQTARAASMLGAQVILTGIQPQIAQTLVSLGVDLGSLITRSTLQEGIRFATEEGTQILLAS